MRPPRLRALATAASLLVALLLGVACDAERSAHGNARPATLRFSAIPDQSSTELREKFDRVAAYLERRLGVPVSYQPAADYAASVEMFRHGDVLLAWFGGLTHLQAVDAVPGARAIAQGEEDRAFTTTFVAHRDTGLAKSAEFPREIADFPFAFGAESSTSGRLMPEHYLRRETGLDAQRFFQHALVFSGSHDKTLALVAAGNLKCGAVSSAVYEASVSAGKIDPELVRAIWVTPPFPDYNFTAHPELETRFGAGFTAKLTAALLEMDEPALLAAFPRRRLVAAQNSDFEPLRSIARDLGLLR
ncbi:MAG: putative selenate ABC transporter substrate-binding protein [Planctomycetes bacterium]|nr:putative selenate ABC transporter substrate-binding protein [Planctomycetota bacterium]